VDRATYETPVKVPIVNWTFYKNYKHTFIIKKRKEKKKNLIYGTSFITSASIEETAILYDQRIDAVHHSQHTTVI
jgi:hypothetical protein